MDNLGSWEMASGKLGIMDFVGKSEDIERLPHNVDSGSSALCLDTGDLYVYHKKTDTWYKL